MKKLLLILLFCTAIATTTVLLYPKSDQTLPSTTTSLFNKTLKIVVSPPSTDILKSSAAINAAIREMTKIEALLNNNSKSSELYQFNTSKSNQPIALSPDAAAIIIASNQLYYQTSKTFDITLKPVIDLWILANKNNQLPNLEELKQKRVQSNWQNLIIEDNTIAKSNPNTQIDLDAVIKGYAIDRAIISLQNAKMKAAIVNLSGNIRSFGQFDNEQLHTFNIKNPYDENQIIATVKLNNAALCTSGSKKKFLNIKNTNYSHLIDPNTLFPTQTNAYVIAIAPTALTADAWATALAVLGPKHIPNLPENIAVLIIQGPPDNLKIFINKACLEYLSQKPSKYELL